MYTGILMICAGGMIIAICSIAFGKEGTIFFATGRKKLVKISGDLHKTPFIQQDNIEIKMCSGEVIIVSVQLSHLIIDEIMDNGEIKYLEFYDISDERIIINSHSIESIKKKNDVLV